MSEFQYTASTASGEKIRGVFEADSESAVLRLLEEKNLFPISVQEISQTNWRKGPLRKKVRARDVGIMYGQLADLLGSGVPLLRTLDSLIRSTVNPGLIEVLREVRNSVADGQSLTEAMRVFPETFPPLHTAMIQAGERASFLEQVFRSLSEFLERLDELRGKIVGALVYPMLLTVLGTAILIGAMLFFVPRLEPLLATVKKPLPTEIIFGMSKIVRAYWYLIAVALAGVAGLVWTSLKNQSNRRLMERWRLKIPVVGAAMQMLAITRFCRILGTMLVNGVPLLQALKICKDATGSILLAERIAEAAESVRDGKTLSAPLQTGGLIPDQILAMLTVAEESNKLDKVLLQIADTVERRTNRQVDQAVRLIEPAILCLVAAGVGFLAMGLLLPILTLASTIGKH